MNFLKLNLNFSLISVVHVMLTLDYPLSPLSCFVTFLNLKFGMGVAKPKYKLVVFFKNPN